MAEQFREIVPEPPRCTSHIREQCVIHAPEAVAFPDQGWKLLEGRAGLMHCAIDIAELGLVGRAAALEDFGHHREAFVLHCLHLDGTITFPDRPLRRPDDSSGDGTAHGPSFLRTRSGS